MKNPTRLFEFIYHQNTHFPQQKAFSYRENGAEASSYSTAQIIELANKVSCGLLALGLRPGDTVGTVTVKNRPEWTILDIGMMQIGVINVPVYPTISAKEYEYIFNEAAVKMCFIGDDKDGSVFKKVKNAQIEIPSLSTLYTFDKVHYVEFWEDIFKQTPELQAEVDRIKETINPHDMATIIYTSGTTGQPKGVMLSHDNVVSNIYSIMPIFPVKAGNRVLSFLPLNHIFERAAAYAYCYVGASVIYTGIDNLGGEGGDLQAAKPHFFTTVPRLLEKVYERIFNKGLELTGIKRRLFFWALSLTSDFEYDEKYSGLEKIKRIIADKLIFSKWRAALGGELKGIVVGASPCPVKIARTFSAAGIPVREGYGLTETSPGIAIGEFTEGGAKLGYVGPVFGDIDLKIDNSDGNYAENEGEIICSGRNVMLGYFKKPEETAKMLKVIDGKTWLYTGDIGKVDIINGRSFLKITDRKKELFKTSGGKYVAPAPIESKLREHFLIEQIMVVGDNQKFVSAIIVPAVEALKDFCNQHNITFNSVAQVIDNQEVVKKYQEVIDKLNVNFSHVEQIKAFRLVGDNWEAIKADGSAAELTPTMKLKRRVVLEKYKLLIGNIYE